MPKASSQRRRRQQGGRVAVMTTMVFAGGDGKDAQRGSKRTKYVTNERATERTNGRAQAESSSYGISDVGVWEQRQQQQQQKKKNNEATGVRSGNRITQFLLPHSHQNVTRTTTFIRSFVHSRQRFWGSQSSSYAAAALVAASDPRCHSWFVGCLSAGSTTLTNSVVIF